MRHASNHKKLNRTSAHRKALLSNLAVALITHEQIKTTVPKAKFLRAFIEKMITKAKNAVGKDAVEQLATRRYLLAALKQHVAVEKLLSDIGPFFASRPGGYTRIMRAGFRHGDMAPVAVMELVGRIQIENGEKLVFDAEKAGDAPQAKAAKKKPATKKPTAPKADSAPKAEKKQAATKKATSAPKKSAAPKRRTSAGA